MRTRKAFLAFGAVLGLYLVSGAWLALAQHFIVGDAWSRVGNASYVLLSRDPHLAAIGFVWNPLPSLLALPFVALRALWPSLVTEGFAGNILSALFMAAAVREMWSILDEARVPRHASVALTALFALHPVVVHYAADGDSEAAFIFLLLFGIRHLSRWLRRNDPVSLVTTALTLAVAYLVRYETAAAALSCVLLVAGVSFARSRGVPRDRIAPVFADAAVIGLPFAMAFTAWAAASWLIVGSPFEQFAGIYGTASQLAADHDNIFAGTGQGTPAAVVYALRQLTGLAPFLLPVGAIAAVLTVRRRDAAILAPLAMIGGVLVFALWAWISGRTGGWFRYYITVVPLVTVLAGYAMRDIRLGAIVRNHIGRLRVLAAIGILSFVAVGLPSSAQTMIDPLLGRGEGDQADDLRRYLAGKEVAAYLDSRALPPGSVIVDVFLGFPIVLQSDNPRQFIITPDRDFRAVLSAPANFGARYLIVPPTSSGLGSLDAIGRQYPGVYETGGGIGRVVHEFEAPMPWLPGAQGFIWRLIELDD